MKSGTKKPLSGKIITKKDYMHFFGISDKTAKKYYEADLKFLNVPRITETAFKRLYPTE